MYTEKKGESIVETDPPDILPYTHHTHIGQSQSQSQAERTSQAKGTCMRSGQKSFIQHAQGIGYCGIAGKDQQGGCSSGMDFPVISAPTMLSL